MHESVETIPPLQDKTLFHQRLNLNELHGGRYILLQELQHQTLHLWVRKVAALLDNQISSGNQSTSEDVRNTISRQ